MFLEAPMICTKLKPLIAIKVFNGFNSQEFVALIDTGSAKAFWVDELELFKKFTTSPIKNDGTAGGLGLHAQKNCPVSTMNLNIRGLNKSGIRFNEVPITCANVKNAGLFSLILPYTLFNGFDFGFKLSGAEPFGLFYLDTPDNQINYKAIAGVNDTVCEACVCTDENIFTKHSNMEKVSAF